MRVLVVEDDFALAKAIMKLLMDENYTVDHAGTGEAADYLVQTEAFDAIVLDLGLPDGSSIQWLQQWREQQKNFAVLVLTAREQWRDKAEAFNAGADDYVTKPFANAEVLLRLRALIRRSFGHAHPRLQVAGLSYDTHTSLVTLDNVQVKLTAYEAKVLDYLFHAMPKIVSRTELTEHVYDGDQEPDSNVLDVQISRLRKKLGNEYIETVRGQGYRLSEPKTYHAE